MDNFNINNPVGKDSDKSVPFDNSGTSGARVSHSPLNLGGKTPGLSQPQGGIGKAKAEKAASSERITGVKTFFVKLHEGSVTFLDEQIGRWLKENPGIVVKMTNAVTGMLMGKKTEPNLVITVWY